jgi:acetyl esterase/lipase
VPCGGITPQTTTVKDFFGNRIRAIAQYGPDPRNIYYIQYNTITGQPNKPIVVLIHGGAWYSGPNPNTTKGWFFGWTAPNSPSTNIVKQLLANGYVVVTPLYPLIAYGRDNAEIVTNTTTIQTQVNNIDMAINHIRNNFPTCLGLNANSIQIIGESAGGHLALNWAYNSANTSYIKSVISMYAPTNMQQYGEYIRVKPFNFTCGGNYNIDPAPPPLNTIHFPWYIHLNLSTNLVTYNTISSPQCIISNSIPNNPNPRILDLFNIIQSSYSQILTLPLSNNNTLLNYSPYNALNVNNIIVPTFIMHGNNDNLVPYSTATNGMSTALDNNGGLIFNYANSGSGTSIPLSSAYASLPDKHGIKIYTNGDHGFTTGPLTLIRGDIIKWLNGHK